MHPIYIVDLFVHFSGPFRGSFFVRGARVLQNPENPPPPLAAALEMIIIVYLLHSDARLATTVQLTMKMHAFCCMN